MRSCSIACALSLSGFIALCAALYAQDGAGYNPAAATVHTPANSLAGGQDSPELDTAIGLLFSGHISEGLAGLQRLAEQGDGKAALFLASIYRQKSRLPVPPDPAAALRFYQIASQHGSGEASEHVAEMIEHREVQPPDNRDAAAWRALAVQQSWVAQELQFVCLTWQHTPEPIHCTTPAASPPGASDSCLSSAEVQELRAAGLTGNLSLSVSSTQRSKGPHARVTLLFDRPVTSEQDLQQPFATDIVYVQTPGPTWRMFPRTAPLLHQFLILKPQPNPGSGTSVQLQNPDASLTGGTCGPP